jgi:hypothetical protein
MSLIKAILMRIMIHMNPSRRTNEMMILKFIRSLLRDKIESLQKELLMILKDLEKIYPSMADITPYENLVIDVCLLKIAILEAILGESCDVKFPL